MASRARIPTAKATFLALLWLRPQRYQAAGKAKAMAEDVKFLCPIIPGAR
jgi:hypothetical protein